MYSPQIHEEIARQRHADLLREARKEQLASLAERAPSTSGALAGARAVAEMLALRLRRRPGRGPAVQPAG